MTAHRMLIMGTGTRILGVLRNTPRTAVHESHDQQLIETADQQATGVGDQQAIRTGPTTLDRAPG
jgi:hypothetical protein